RLRRELCVWQRLKHKNVLVLHGIALNFGHCPGFVCPWLENGSISKYLRKQSTNLLMTHRLQLLCEIAAGLSYLHASGVVHGDLTGANILVADDGSACLCDFGLSSIATEFQGTSYITSTMGGNVRWLASELLYVAEDGIIPMVNTHSDVYSYGSVTLEILSGQLPFPYLPREAQVIMQLYSGIKCRRPEAPYVTDQLWVFINKCWLDIPAARPAAEEL
ncbi:kinase-like protein, partial [Athelia psychrophila]